MNEMTQSLVMALLLDVHRRKGSPSIVPAYPRIGHDDGNEKGIRIYSRDSHLAANGSSLNSSDSESASVSVSMCRSQEEG